jgi:hypothetical protein
MSYNPFFKGDIMGHNYEFDDVERMGLILKLTMLIDYLESDDRLDAEMRETLVKSSMKLRERIEGESRSTTDMEKLRDIWEQEGTQRNDETE